MDVGGEIYIVLRVPFWSNSEVVSRTGAVISVHDERSDASFLCGINRRLLNVLRGLEDTGVYLGNKLLNRFFSLLRLP